MHLFSCSWHILLCFKSSKVICWLEMWHPRSSITTKGAHSLKYRPWFDVVHYNLSYLLVCTSDSSRIKCSASTLSFCILFHRLETQNTLRCLNGKDRRSTWPLVVPSRLRGLKRRVVQWCHEDKLLSHFLFFFTTAQCLFSHTDTDICMHAPLGGQTPTLPNTHSL